MPNPSTLKPGFLLIEIMGAFLLIVLGCTVLGLYGAFMQKQQKIAQIRMEALRAANQAIDRMREGFIPVSREKYPVNITQKSIPVYWADKEDLVWAITVEVGKQANFVALQTFLTQKAL